MSALQRSASQRRGYRRGSVLGLTVAEIALLFLFVVLLIMAGSRDSDDEAVDDSDSEPGGDSVVITVPRREWNEAWKTLVPADEPRGTGTDLVGGLTGKITSLEDEIGERDATIARLRRGSGFPSCLNVGNGVVFLLDIALQDDGYLVALTGDVKVRSDLVNSRLGGYRGPSPWALPDRVLSVREFEEHVGGLYRWSDENRCRFFVNVYDATGSSKDTYKERLAAVERRFYKRERGGVFPDQR